MEWASGDTGTEAFRKLLFSFGLPGLPHSIHFAICWTTCFTTILAGLYSTSVRTSFLLITFILPPQIPHVSSVGITYSSISSGSPASISWRIPGWRGFRSCGFTAIFVFERFSCSASSWVDSNNDNCPSTCLETSVDGPNNFFLAWSRAWIMLSIWIFCFLIFASCFSMILFLFSSSCACFAARALNISNSSCSVMPFSFSFSIRILYHFSRYFSTVLQELQH